MASDSIFHFNQPGDPGAVGAGHYWLDTGTPSVPVIKRRNEANDDWVAIGAAAAHSHAEADVVDLVGDLTDLVVGAASDTVAGKVELATTAETTTGTDATRAVTPDGLHDMTSLAGAVWFLDEDAMGSDSATKTASQQSIKAYVDAQFGAVPAASDTVAGKVELATTAETTTGTDATRAVTPDGLHDMTSLAGAAWFLDEDNMASDSATKTASQQSIKAYADTKQPLDTDLTVIAGLADPNADRLLFWDDSAGSYAYLTPGTGLTITTTTIDGVAAYTDEQAQDAIAAAIAAGSHTGITVTYTDASNKFDFAVTASGDGVPRFGWATTRYMIHPYHTPGWGDFTGAVLVANRVYCGPPMFFKRAGTITEMSIFVNSAATAGKIARLGLYAVGDDGIPTTPALDAGTVLVDATGARQITGLSLVPSANTWYVPAIVSDGAPTILRAPSTQAGNWMPYSASTISNVAPEKNVVVYDNVAGSAFGSPFVVDGYEASAGGGPPVIWIKQT